MTTRHIGTSNAARVNFRMVSVSGSHEGTT